MEYEDPHRRSLPFPRIRTPEPSAGARRRGGEQGGLRLAAEEVRGGLEVRVARRGVARDLLRRGPQRPVGKIGRVEHAAESQQVHLRTGRYIYAKYLRPERCIFGKM